MDLSAILILVIVIDEPMLDDKPNDEDGVAKSCGVRGVSEISGVDGVMLIDGTIEN